MRAADAYRAKQRKPGILVAELEHHPLIAKIAIKEDRPLDASAWRATPKGGGAAVPLSKCRPSFGDEAVFVSVRQQRDGRHDFVCLANALSGANPCAVLDEASVKGRGALVYARPPGAAATAAPPATLWDHRDLAPHGTWTNYSVVPWLCMGRTQAVMLSDEETLCRDLPGEPIFQHLRLVVNCHQERPGRAYQAGKPWMSGRPPDVVSHAVHTWFSDQGARTNKKIDDINEKMWAAVQEGTVAVHCLAGIHRAACIMACHFLYRHYVLGHKHIPCDTADIYRKMISVRPHVSPAYEDILRGYEKYLKAGRR
mmetsp:Transcript_34020/g.102698  ORF Transcript_34020/g.102698 Transcript_34020/m.102698 type:complete len:312 (+) Transcript_34020:968-1903(+)